jgi:hypothetical protein
MAIATAAAIFSSGCTTTSTQRQVLSEPMSSDLEAKVMKETGISGAAIGALVGGVTTGALTFATLAATGSSMEQAATGAAIGAAAGAVGGGITGYGQGKKQGQKLVAQAMTRDQVAEYVKGARAYNVHLAKTNATLRTALARAKSTGDKKTLNIIRKEGTAELKSLDQRIASRTKAVNNLEWPSGSGKAQYKSELSQAKTQRAQLAKILAESSQPIL